MTDNRTAWGPLIFALFATLCLAYFLAPLRSVILWSIILAVIFGATNERMTRRLGGRNRGALATLGVIMLTAILPFVLIAIVTSGQLVSLVNNANALVAEGADVLNGAVASLPDGARLWIENMVASIDISVEQIGRLVLPTLSYSLSIGSNLAVFVASMFAVLYVTFFLLRDRREIVRFLSAAIPLRTAQKDVLSARLSNTLSATVQGVILVAAAQALIAGIIYALLGIEFYAVLAAITFIGCLIPAIGSGLVWLPVSVYYFLTGQTTEGIIMLASGALLISSIDNILRPKLIADKAALPDFLIFLSSIGGLVVVGFDGLFLGPIVAAFFIESWNVYLGVSGRDPAPDDQTTASEEAG